MTAPWRDRPRVERLARAGRRALALCLGRLDPLRPRRGVERWDVPIREALAGRPRTDPASEAWRQAEALWWRLAMTASRLAEVEARRHASGLASTGLGVDDLQTAGLFGAYRSAQGWNPDGGAGWPSYVGYGVVTEIRRYLRDHRPIGANDQARRLNLQKALADQERRGGTAYVPWAAEWLGLDPDQAKLLLDAATEVRLDARAGDGDGRLGDVLGGEPWDPTDALDQDSREAEIRRCLAKIEPRRRTILQQRSEGRSLREVAEQLGVSPERVRQLERQGQAELRPLLIAAGLGGREPDQEEEVACPS